MKKMNGLINIIIIFFVLILSSCSSMQLTESTPEILDSTQIPTLTVEPKEMTLEQSPVPEITSEPQKTNTSIVTLKPDPEELDGTIVTNEFRLNFATGENKETLSNFEDLHCEQIVGYSVQDEIILCSDKRFSDEKFSNYFYYSLQIGEITDVSIPNNLSIFQFLDDGKKILAGHFLENGFYSAPYYILDRETLAVIKEYDIESSSFIPVISKTGKYIAYYSLQNGENVLKIEGDDFSVILTNDDFGANIAAFSWSPNEEMLAIGVTDIIQPEPPLTNLFVYDVIEKKITAYNEVLDGRAFWNFGRTNDYVYFQIGFPKQVWSPDSQFISINTYSEEICLLDVSTEELNCLNVPNKPAVSLYKYYFWSPDSKNIAVITYSPNARTYSPNVIEIYDVETLHHLFHVQCQGSVEFAYWLGHDE